MCEERFNQVEKTYTYCDTSPRKTTLKKGYPPVAIVEHTLDGRALFWDFKNPKIATSRDEAHQLAWKLKHPHYPEAQ